MTEETHTAPFTVWSVGDVRVAGGFMFGTEIHPLNIAGEREVRKQLWQKSYEPKDIPITRHCSWLFHTDRKETQKRRGRHSGDRNRAPPLCVQPWNQLPVNCRKGRKKRLQMVRDGKKE